MDDWNAEADEDRSASALARRVSGRMGPDPEALTDLARAWRPPRTPCWSPAPTSTPPAAGTLPSRWLSEQHLPVWASPATGGSRLGFPERHPNFVGVLPPAIGAVSETLKDHDSYWSSDPRCFPTTPTSPGPLLAEGTSWSR